MGAEQEPQFRINLRLWSVYLKNPRFLFIKNHLDFKERKMNRQKIISSELENSLRDWVSLSIYMLIDFQNVFSACFCMYFWVDLTNLRLLLETA